MTTKLLYDGVIGEASKLGSDAYREEFWDTVYYAVKPGAHLAIIAESSPRSYHRLALVIEDAGFEIRDQLLWIDDAHHHQIVLARCPFSGTVVSNVLMNGAGALNIRACRIAGIDPANARRLGKNYGDTSSDTFGQVKHAVVGGSLDGRFPANVLHSGSDAVEAAFAEFGELRARGNKGMAKGGGGMFGHGLCENDFGAGDGGSASRFFAIAKDIPELLAWLAKLITPPSGATLNLSEECIQSRDR